jgi:hypothetical protein
MEVADDGWVVNVRPEQVIEIAFDALQRSIPLSPPAAAAVHAGRALPRR